MLNTSNTPNNDLNSTLFKDTKINQLRAYISREKYIEIEDRLSICESFGLQLQTKIFEDIYRNRVYDFLLTNTTTMATVEHETDIPHKYLTQCKAYFEKLGKLEVIYLGKCPTTGSTNVQFVSTNPNEFGKIQVSNQLNLFV
jgi:hypothetical protein